jgi:hypothetical protein
MLKIYKESEIERDIWLIGHEEEMFSFSTRLKQLCHFTTSSYMLW